MTKDQLKILANSIGVRSDVFEIWYPYFNNYLASEGINTPERILSFLAQTAQESGNWYYTEEISNSTCSGYEGGCQFKGRGLIQLTHLSNYINFGKKYGINSANNPSLVGGQYATTSTPEQLKNSLLASTYYWNNGNLNDLADKLDLNQSVYSAANNQYFKCIGRKINRGINTNCATPANGEDTRLAKFEALRLAYNANKSQFQTLGKKPNRFLIPVVITVSVGLAFTGIWLIHRHAKKNK